MWKKATLLSLAGFAGGIVICVLFIVLWPEGSFDLEAALPHLLIGGSYGAAAMGSSVVYDIEKWSILRATATHFLFILIGYSVVSLTLGWFRIEDGTFWIMIAVFVAVYFLIWLIQYLIYRKQVSRMNENLRKWKSSRKSENPKR